MVPFCGDLASNLLAERPQPQHPVHGRGDALVRAQHHEGVDHVLHQHNVARCELLCFCLRPSLLFHEISCLVLPRLHRAVQDQHLGHRMDGGQRHRVHQEVLPARCRGQRRARLGAHQGAPIVLVPDDVIEQREEEGEDVMLQLLFCLVVQLAFAVPVAILSAATHSLLNQLQPPRLLGRQSVGWLAPSYLSDCGPVLYADLCAEPQVVRSLAELALVFCSRGGLEGLYRVSVRIFQIWYLEGAKINLASRPDMLLQGFHRRRSLLVYAV
jgi:hypothetical protein